MGLAKELIELTRCPCCGENQLSKPGMLPICESGHVVCNACLEKGGWNKTHGGRFECTFCDDTLKVQWSWVATKLKSILGDYKINPLTSLKLKPENGTPPTYIKGLDECGWNAQDGPSDPGPPPSSPSTSSAGGAQTDSADEEVKAIIGRGEGGRDEVTEKELQDAIKSIQ